MSDTPRTAALIEHARTMAEVLDSHEQMEHELAAVTAERDALRADAMRYKWLRKFACMSLPSPEGSTCKEAYLVCTGYGDEQSNDVIDAAVDATIAAKQARAIESEVRK